MKPSFAAALLSLSLAPLAAHAQTSEAPPAVAAPATALAAAPPAAPAAEPVGPWSLGAGIGYVAYGPGFVAGFAARPFGGSQLPSVATVQASLERAVAPAWWLVLGAAGSIYQFSGEAPAGSYQSTRDDSSSASLSIGARRALTRPGAPVTVSTSLLLSAGYGRYSEDLAYPTPETRRGEAWGVGLTLGLAVERELTSGLSLRVATPLVGASWSRSTLDSSANGLSSSEGGGASLLLAPSLELRLAF
jgi:hypothetical protein